MKRLLVALLLGKASLIAYSQGTVLFDNIAGQGQLVNAPVYESDAVTKVSGPQFMVELLGGPSAESLVSIATTGFLTGTAAGYFLGGGQTVPGVNPGTLAW